MNVWDFLKDLFSSLVQSLTPLFEYEYGGFTYWQYALFAFLICSVVRFVFPLVSGGDIGASGVVTGIKVDRYKKDLESRRRSGRR